MKTDELWEELNFEINMCKVIQIKEKNKKILLGGGNRESNLLFIGDDPNLFEDEYLRVTSNSSGAFFKNLYELVDFNPESFYLTNIVKCNLRLKDLSQEEQKKYSDILDMQIAIINPKVIVCLGQEVAKFILNDSSLKMSQIRGKIYNWDGGITVIPIFDPSFLMRNSDKKKGSPKWTTWKDMENIKNIIIEKTT